MKSTLNIKSEPIQRAAELTGVTEKTALVEKGLLALIAMESSKRLAKLGGSEPSLELPRRRRTRARQ